MSDELSLYPTWKQAARDFLEAAFPPGSLITHAWLEEHFEMPAPADPMTFKAFQTRQFEWLRNVDSLRTYLLEDHQIYLESIAGEGYRVVPPSEQTKVADGRFEREAARAFQRVTTALENVRVEQLTDAQRRENTDAVAKIAMLRGMARKALKGS